MAESAPFAGNVVSQQLAEKLQQQQRIIEQHEMEQQKVVQQKQLEELQQEEPKTSHEHQGSVNPFSRQPSEVEPSAPSTNPFRKTEDSLYPIIYCIGVDSRTSDAKNILYL